MLLSYAFSFLFFSFYSFGINTLTTKNIIFAPIVKIDTPTLPNLIAEKSAAF